MDIRGHWHPSTQVPRIPSIEKPGTCVSRIEKPGTQDARIPGYLDNCVYKLMSAAGSIHFADDMPAQGVIS